MPALTAAAASTLILAGLDAYDAVARRRGIATLDAEAREEAIRQAQADSEARYGLASDDLADAIEASRRDAETDDTETA